MYQEKNKVHYDIYRKKKRWIGSLKNAFWNNLTHKFIFQKNAKGENGVWSKRGALAVR